jgi:hypothetical protein
VRLALSFPCGAEAASLLSPIILKPGIRGIQAPVGDFAPRNETCRWHQQICADSHTSKDFPSGTGSCIHVPHSFRGARV